MLQVITKSVYRRLDSEINYNIANVRMQGKQLHNMFAPIEPIIVWRKMMASKKKT